MRASRWFNHHFYFTFGGRSAKCSAKNTGFAAVGCLLSQFLKKKGPKTEVWVCGKNTRGFMGHQVV